MSENAATCTAASDTRRIADYAIIGDGRTVALIRKSGALEWMCWPRFDADACFAALVGQPQNGHWTITPDAPFRASRSYRPHTMVLDTSFETESGRAVLTDFMPIDGSLPSVVRSVRCEAGAVPLRMEFAPAFENGKTVPQFTRDHSTLVARAGESEIRLSASREAALAATCRVELALGEELCFVLAAERFDADKTAKQAVRQAESYWRHWCAQCSYQGPWRDTVLRSLMVLKALIYRPNGGIVAAPTTSLPEWYGGSRNWDYRYCWLRDSTLTVLALLHAGYRDEARDWVHWLLRAISPDTNRTQPVYGVIGNSGLAERDADWLSGFHASRPVRIGNAAYRQIQLDIYGEVQDTLHQWRSFGGDAGSPSWTTQQELLQRLETLWHEPDAGFWEQRGKAEYFTQSRSQAWLAFDRAARAVKEFGLEGPAEHWRELGEQVHDEVCRRGFSTRLNAFTRSYGSESFDSSTLLLPMVGFLPPDDPRIAGTISGIARHLMRDGFVYRYDQTADDDGIGEQEGAFLPCCFWYADGLILQKRQDEAASAFEKFLSAANDVGLLAEEYDALSGELLGNFPQALSHLALVTTALNLCAPGLAHTRSGASR